MQGQKKRLTRLRAAGAVGFAGAMAVGGLAALGGSPGVASSHREAPQIALDPAVDNTDVYAFVSPDRKNTVTLLGNWFPFQEPNGGPNFYPFATDARYNIKVDNDGDGNADITYRWTFKNRDRRDNAETFLYNNGPVTKLRDENLLFRQQYTLTKVTDDGSKVLRRGQVAPSFTGKASMPNYLKLRREAVDKIRGGGRTYAGAADDSFFLDLRVFDLLYGGDLSETGRDTLAGYNVNTLAVQIPKKDLALEGNAKRNPVIGVWATTDRATETDLSDEPGEADSVAGLDDDEFTQVSRLGNPLINEVIDAVGMKDKFNRRNPSEDADSQEFVDRVLNPEVPKLLKSIYGLDAARSTPRKDLLEIFATGIANDNGLPLKVGDLNWHGLNADVDKDELVPAEMQRLNMSVPVTPEDERSPLGVLGGDLQGFPNGRRLGDDVVDIELQALAGAVQNKGVKIVDALAAGDGVNCNNKHFTDKFPYVAGPNQDSVNRGVGPVGGD